MEKNVDKKNPLEELFKKHYVSGERAYDYADDAELEDYLDRLEQKRQEEEEMIIPCINSETDEQAKSIATLPTSIPLGTRTTAQSDTNLSMCPKNLKKKRYFSKESAKFVLFLPTAAQQHIYQQRQKGHT